MLDIKKDIKFYSIFTIFTLIFGIIYELFSHQVYSNYMIYAFIIPLLLGIIYIIFKELINKDIYKLSVITFTIGSILKGILDIYGTTNNLIYVYLIVGIILLLLSLKKGY